MVEEQEQDPELKKQRDRIKQGKAEGAETKRHIFFHKILYHLSNPNDHPVTRMYIPKQLRKVVLDQYHDINGRMGMDKTYDTIGVKYYWPNMFKEVLEYIQGCVAC